MRRLFFLLALTIASPAWAQETDSQLWFAANGDVRLAEKTKLTIETIGRFSDKAGGFAHAELGGVVTHVLPGGVEIAAGHRHVQDWDHGRRLASEERVRQMITVPLGAGFSGRLRFEERFHESGGEIGFRLRPRIDYKLPLGHALTLWAAHESNFNFNTTRWGQRAGHERMRNMLGLSFPITDGVSADAGYLNQYNFGRDGARDRMIHAATFSLNLRL